MVEPTTEQLIEEQKVRKFFIAALSDEALLHQLETALDANDESTIVTLAALGGYNFSQESLRLGLKNIANLIAPIALVEQE